MKKIPFIPQFNSTECGVCVLTMVLHYYGAKYSIQEVRNHLPTGRDGVTVQALIDAFAYYNIRASAYHGVIENDFVYKLPAIVNWEDNHYIILTHMNKKYVFIMDSNIGSIKMTYEEFNESYSGIIILLSPTDQFHRVKKKYQLKNSFSSIFSYYKNNIALLILLSFFTIEEIELVAKFRNSVNYVCKIENIINGDIAENIGDNIYAILLH